MPYNGKTDWKLNDTVYAEDMNRIEGQIEKNTSEIEGVSGKIGNPSDGEEQLTLFGKLAAILTKVLGIDTKVGTSDDTKTKPTLFGKIAGIGDTLSENLTPVTEKITEVLNKVTCVDGKIGTVADGAEQGTLFGKIQKIIGATSAPRYVYSDTIQATAEGYSGSGNNYTTAVLYNMVAEYDGIIGFEALFYMKGSNSSHMLFPVAISSSMPKGRLDKLAAGFEELYNKPAGTVYKHTSWSTSGLDFPIFFNTNVAAFQNISMYEFTGSAGGTNTTARLDVECKKGDHVLFLVCLNANTSGNSVAEFSISNIKVLYDVV